MTSDVRAIPPPDLYAVAEQSATGYAASVAAVARRRTAVQRTMLVVDSFSARRDAAPVLCAEVLLHHGLSDDAILGHLARSWPLDQIDCRAALDAAHILLRREVPHDSATTGE